MTKDQKTTAIIITASVLFVALVAFILWRMYKRKSTTANTEDGSFPLQEGSLGNNVKLLQEYLNRRMAAMELPDEMKLVPLKVDGIFGTKTKNACYLVFGVESVTEDQFKSLK